MTNIEALAGAVNYPVDNSKLEKLLIDNGLNTQDTYTGITMPFELATAGLYVLLVTSANISEGGYQVSATDKSNMITLAGGIYTKYGISNPLRSKPVIVNRSNYW